MYKVYRNKIQRGSKYWRMLSTHIALQSRNTSLFGYIAKHKCLIGLIFKEIWSMETGIKFREIYQKIFKAYICS